MRTKRSREGYLLIDNRNAPAVTQPDGTLLPSGAALEAATITCSHCHRQMIRNPGRERPRAYCAKCDHYICDWCHAARKGVDECQTLVKVFDELEASILKSHNRILLP